MSSPQNGSSLFDLQGKVAAVTGGAGLLGNEHAIALLDQGATVFLLDVRLDECLKARDQLRGEGHDQVHALQLDVTSRESWTTAVARIVEQFGCLDVLVNNAALTGKTVAPTASEFEDVPLEVWNATMNVNLTGTFLGCQVAGQQMLQQESGGAIINVASLYGVVSPNHRIYPGTGIKSPVAYTVSKHGVVALTKYVATLWADRGIRVNALSPGGIFDGHDGDFLANYKKMCPMGRMSDRKEMRGAVVFLASRASSHVTGHNLVVDGGWSVW